MIQLRNTTIFFFNNLKDIITANKLFLIIFFSLKNSNFTIVVCGQFEGIYVTKL
jgi:hypothetical protein